MAAPAMSADGGARAAGIQPVEELDEIDYEALGDKFGLGANLIAGAFAGIAEHTVM